MGSKVLFIALFAFATLAPVTAQPALSPTPTRTAGSSSPTTVMKPAQSSPCLARVAFVIPLDAEASGMARSYVLALAPSSTSAGLASGTVSLYDAANRWEVPFRDAVAAGEGQTPDPTPIVIRFPQPVRLDGGRLASLTGPNGGPCSPFSVAAQTRTSVTNKFVARILAKAPSVPLIDAPQPVPDAAPVCAQPDVASQDVKAADLDMSARTRLAGLTGVVAVSVLLDDIGEVLAARVSQSSGSQLLDDAALGAAVSSVYSPRVHACRAIGDTYFFRVDFQR